MKNRGQLLPEHTRVEHVGDASEPDAVTRLKSVDEAGGSTSVLLTRNHEVIRRWAEERQAQPATGEATRSGPATVRVNDGGAGVRFTFPGYSVYREITWDEWFANFDEHNCAFVFDDDTSRPLSNRYRIVKAEEWSEFLS